MGKFFRRLNYWLRPSQADADLAEEMEFHRALSQRDSGEGPDAARRAMGNATLAREDARAVWIWPWLESVWQDLAYGIRAMRKQPGFTAVALLALGGSIGIDTSLFTVFDAQALRSWQVSDPASVVEIFRASGGGNPASGFAVAEYRYLAEHAKSLSGLLLTRNGSRVLLDNQPAQLTYVSGNYFRVLGVEMLRGGGFPNGTDRMGVAKAVAVISYAAWQNRFGADPAIIGKQVRIDGVSFTVTGVAPSSFTGTSPLRNDIWAPLSSILLLRPNDPGAAQFLTSPDYCCSTVAGRLAPGVTREQAQSEIITLTGQFRRANPLKEKPAGRNEIMVTGTRWLDVPDGDRARIIPSLALMFLAVTLVLLLACANVGNLLLARAAARRREIAIRLSLGGSRARVIRQLLVESLVLALAASGIGLAIAWIGMPLLASRMSNEVVIRLTPDLRVLAYAIFLALVACLAFGLAPAFHGTRGNITAALKDGGGYFPAMRLSLRGLLLSAQVAISVMLLTGAGLLVRGLQRAENQDPGFAIHGVTVVSFNLPASAYGAARTVAFAQALVNNLESPAGASSGTLTVGLTSDAPLARGRSVTSFYRPDLPSRQTRLILAYDVSPGYFDVLRIPIVAGRNFRRGGEDHPAVLINQTAAKRYWPGENPAGKFIGLGPVSDPAYEIVGVARDAYTSELGALEPIVYYPITGRAVPMVLASGSPGAAERVAAVARQYDERIRVESVPLMDYFNGSLDRARIGASLAGVLGLVALLLASAGMSGVFAYVVRQRTREIGIRMALGAHPRDAVRLVLRSNLRPIAAGIAVGMAAAAAISKLLASQFFGVGPFDPAAYAGVAMLLALAGLAAGAVPARRAARVDPVRALRFE